MFGSTSRGASALLWIALGLGLFSGCGNNSGPAPAGSGSANMPVSAAPPTATLAPPVDAGAADAAPSDAGPSAEADAGSPSAAPIVKDNKVKPITDEELQGRAKLLFEGIVKNDAAIAEPLWFPRDVFLDLKDIKDPGKYWDQLHRAYARDIEKLHKKQKSWEGATFDRLDIGSPPKWVKPGDEGNKIGYYRTTKSTLHFTQDGKAHTLEVRVMITWQGRFFITHLSKFK